MQWRQIDPGAERRLREEIRRWLRTPYEPRSRVCGMGVDCVNLVAAVLDTMFRCDVPTAVDRMVPRREMVRAIRRGWHGSDSTVTDCSGPDGMGDPLVVEPGDILVVAQWDGEDLTPHATIACPEPMMVCHATSAVGVHTSSVRALPPIVRTYRPRRKDLWCDDSSLCLCSRPSSGSRIPADPPASTRS